MAELRLNGEMNLLSTRYRVSSDCACRFKRQKWMVEVLRETSSDIGRIGLTGEKRELLIVAQFSWDDIASEDFGNPARQAWRTAVAEIAEKAKATLPQCNGRVEKAVAIVLNGDVELLPEGKAKVASQSNGTTKKCARMTKVI